VHNANGAAAGFAELVRAEDNGSRWRMLSFGKAVRFAVAGTDMLKSVMHPPIDRGRGGGVRQYYVHWNRLPVLCPDEENAQTTFPVQHILISYH
jgi:hypothetical protein